MLELSLQPTNLERLPGQTRYVWDYHRLLYGRPIALDVLGIAPIDRLGELSWLGPVSVIVFGLLIGLVSRAYRLDRFDRWMLLLVLGTFTGGYPLMYFAQNFLALRWAILSAAGVVMIVIGWRVITIMPLRVALFGVLVPAAAIMALTLLAAVQPRWQGMILTVGALCFFIAAMLLMPKIHPAEPQPVAT